MTSPNPNPNPDASLDAAVFATLDGGNPTPAMPRITAPTVQAPAIVPVPVPVPTPTPQKNAPVHTHREFRTILDLLRDGKASSTPEADPFPPAKGKTIKKSALMVNRDVYEWTLRDFLKPRGAFFRAPYPYYFDRVEHTLQRISPNPSGEFARTLRRIGLLAGETHTALIAKNVANVADLAPLRPLHHFAYASSDAIYLRQSPTTMLKITTDTIETVPLGTDEVVLIADDLADLPTIADLKPHMDALRPHVGRTCVSLIPGLPLTETLTTRYALNAAYTPEQARMMLIARFLFLAVGSRYALWPILTHVGPQNSGKSTPYEIMLALLHGRRVAPTSIPAQPGDLIASATNRSIVVYDNVDDADPKKYNDLFALVATGGEVDLRVLFETNKLVSYPVHNHLFMTSRVNPFSRSDVLRRMIVLDVQPSEGAIARPKDEILEEALANRTQVWAEYALRAQNILRAHLSATHRHRSYSEMTEYETYTLTCAEYEGNSPAMEACWDAHNAQYREGATASNPLVHVCRLWVGKKGNVRREVSATTLYLELQELCATNNLNFSYRSAAAFGKNLATNFAALQIIGLDKRRTNTGRNYIFNPSPEEQSQCAQMYKDMAAVTAKSDTSRYTRGQYNPQSRRTTLDDTDEDDRIHDIGTTLN
jgi:hypothetical protein